MGRSNPSGYPRMATGSPRSRPSRVRSHRRAQPPDGTGVAAGCSQLPPQSSGLVLRGLQRVANALQLGLEMRRDALGFTGAPAAIQLHPRESRSDDQQDHNEDLGRAPERSEEHTPELQSPCNLVCRLLLEKKKKYKKELNKQQCTITVDRSSSRPQS